MMTLGELIRRRRLALGLHLKDVAEAVNRSVSLVSDWEANRRRPTIDVMPDLAAVLQMSIEELYELAELPEDAYPASEDVVMLPVVSQVKAGMPKWTEEDVLGVRAIEAERVRGGTYFWMRVEGDSMTGAGIPPGAYVLVRKQPTVENGQIAVVDVEDEGVTIKRVHITDGHVILYAENPEYAPMIVPKNRVRIIGKVKLCQIEF